MKKGRRTIMGSKNIDAAFDLMRSGAFDSTGKNVSQTMADRIVYATLCKASADVDELPKHQYKAPEDDEYYSMLQPHNDFVPLPPRCFIGNAPDIAGLLSREDIKQQVRMSINRLVASGLITTFRLPHTIYAYMYVLNIQDKYYEAVNEAVEPWKMEKYKPCCCDELNKGWHLDVGESLRQVYFVDRERMKQIDLKLLDLRRQLTFEGWRYLIR